MDKTKKKKVQMPSGIRSKLTAAIAMLLISSLLVVGSTYAWFTLSTAPEVTGITTSVGANGNLEIALLNGVKDGTEDTDTYADMSKIKSAVGDSSAVQAVTAANITWGNLVDLSDTSYGWNMVSLLPAEANITDNTINVNSLLKTAVYGADGRVKELAENTVSAVYNGTTFATAAAQSYGARAIGVTSTMTAREIILNSAKGSFNRSRNNSSTPIATAVNTKVNDLMSIAMKAESGGAYNAQELAAMTTIANGAKTSLENIVNAYANAALAVAAANNSITDEALSTLKGNIAGITSATDLKTKLNAVSIGTHDGVLGTLATAQSDVATAISNLATYIEHGTTDAATVKEGAVKYLIGTGANVKAYNEGGGDVDLSISNATSIKSIYLNGGAVGTIAAETGNFQLTTYMGIPVYAGTKDVTGGALVTLAGQVTTLSVTGGTPETNISDVYGYVVDFAFRTNAAGSKLQLQTSAKNRVYTDGGTATQGSGSTVTFAYGSGLSATQANTLLSNINLVFFNPDNGNVYAKAGLINVRDNAGASATADVKVIGQGDAEVGEIVDLAQNTATKVSVLVYLDGNHVQNSDVAIGGTSGNLALNLQFSSSADLTPMQNTNLKNMTK